MPVQTKARENNINKVQKKLISKKILLKRFEVHENKGNL